MSTDLTTATDRAAIMERVVIAGDLSKLTPTERVSYYQATCESLGLNPLTKPFEYISLNGKLTLYATRTATDQLRSLKSVSISPTRRELNADAGIYIVEVKAHTPDGRCDFASGVVTVGNLKSDALANAMMKAETKAKRRATLSICGLGWMDETETETVPTATKVAVDHSTGMVVDPPAANGRQREVGDEPEEPPRQPGKASAQRADALWAIEEAHTVAELTAEMDKLPRVFSGTILAELTAAAQELLEGKLLLAKGKTDESAMLDKMEACARKRLSPERAAFVIRAIEQHRKRPAAGDGFPESRPMTESQGAPVATQNET